MHQRGRTHMLTGTTSQLKEDYVCIRCPNDPIFGKINDQLILISQSHRHLQFFISKGKVAVGRPPFCSGSFVFKQHVNPRPRILPVARLAHGSIISLYDIGASRSSIVSPRLAVVGTRYFLGPPDPEPVRGSTQERESDHRRNACLCCRLLGVLHSEHYSWLKWPLIS